MSTMKCLDGDGSMPDFPLDKTIDIRLTPIWQRFFKKLYNKILDANRKIDEILVSIVFRYILYKKARL